jgi:hypothetical protein
MEVDDEDAKEEEAVLVRVKDNPDKKEKRQPRAQRKKEYLDVIKESTNPETVFNEVMKRPVTIKLQDLFACSPTFAKLLFKGVDIPKGTEEAGVPQARVGSIGLRRRQREEKTYAAKTPKLLVKVDGAST